MTIFVAVVVAVAVMLCFNLDFKASGPAGATFAAAWGLVLMSLIAALLVLAKGWP